MASMRFQDILPKELFYELSGETILVYKKDQSYYFTEKTNIEIKQELCANRLFTTICLLNLLYFSKSMGAQYAYVFNTQFC